MDGTWRCSDRGAEGAPASRTAWVAPSHRKRVHAPVVGHLLAPPFSRWPPPLRPSGARRRAPSWSSPVEQRQFLSENGELWLVYEVLRSSAADQGRNILPADYTAGWLVFQSAREKRRLAPVPEDWATYDVGALEALRRRAQPARSAPRELELDLIALSGTHRASDRLSR